MYTVQLKVTYKDNVRYLKTYTSVESEELAIETALAHFYKSIYIDAPETQKEIEKELSAFKTALKDLSNQTLLKFIPNQEVISEEYRKALENELGRKLLPIDSFEQFRFMSKIIYLSEIGYSVKYLSYPKGAKFEIHTIN